MTLGRAALLLLALVACSPSPAPPAPRALPSFPGDDAIRACEQDPARALQLLAGAERPDAAPAMRIAYLAARWSKDRAPGRFAEALSQAGLDPAQPAVSAASLRLTRRALDLEAVGFAALVYGGWLPAQHAPLSAEARTLAGDLHDALDGDAPDLAESLATAVLTIDPDCAAIAEALVGGMLADDILAFLTAHATASWVKDIARRLPELATLGDLEDAATVDRLAQAMHRFAGIEIEDARAQLAAALAGLRKGR